MTIHAHAKGANMSDTQQTVLDLIAIEKAALAVPPQKRRWFQMQEQDGEVLPDGTGYVGDYEPSREVVIGEPDADGRFASPDYFDLPTVALAAFISTADPETMLAMVAEVHRLRRDLAQANLVIRLDEARADRSDFAPQCCAARCQWMPVRRIRFGDEGREDVHACSHHKDEVIERTAYTPGGSSVDKRLADGSWSGEAR